MKPLKVLVIVFLFLLSLTPGLALADGGMVVWPPPVHLSQSAQNAIVAWAGGKEVMMISNDIKSDSQATVLRIIPLPSNPSKIQEGSFDSFEKLVELMNKKIEKVRDQYLGEGKEAGAPNAGIEITFQEKIGAHDVTVVKVDDLDYFLDWVKEFAKSKGLEEKEISSEFKDGIANYLQRGISYFVFDVLKSGRTKESINPLVYQFNSDYLYYPLKITAVSDISQSLAKVHIFFITEKEISYTPFKNLGGWFNISYPVELTKAELKEIFPQTAGLFADKAIVEEVSFTGRLGSLKKDVLLFSSHLWERSLGLGSSGEEVRGLQELLINEGFWDSTVGATGYFGPITRKALIKFQEKYSVEILEPLGLKSGTGYFGEITRNYLKEASIETKRAEWSRNLILGMRGDDVRSLQEMLIKENLWGNPEVEATGYFGPITKTAVIKFQEKYVSDILEPFGLKKGTGFVGPSTRAFLKNHSQKIEDFCGKSTYGKCNSDDDCKAGGCSGQVCESTIESPVVTTCEWKDCYNAKNYNLECKCVENKCQWSK